LTLVEVATDHAALPIDANKLTRLPFDFAMWMATPEETREPGR
jgi:hypothetical protein